MIASVTVEERTIRQWTVTAGPGSTLEQLLAAVGGSHAGLVHGPVPLKATLAEVLPLDDGGIRLTYEQGRQQ